MNKLSLFIAALAGIVTIVMLLLQQPVYWQPAGLLALVSFTVGMRTIPALATYQYTAWIIVAVAAAMLYPQAFTNWGGFDLRNKWLILIIIQLVMFGMGIQMSIHDFAGLRSSGKGVLIGLFCHFTVMPLMGLLLTKLFRFEPEIAAGVILIGSCSSGLASNVMVYLAKANLVLSVVVTAMATLAAPFLTPLLLKLLAGTLINISFVNMMMEIIKIVIVPIFAALLHDYLKQATPRGKRVVTLAAFVAAGWLVFLATGGWQLIGEIMQQPQSLQAAEIFSFLVGAVLVGVVYHQLTLRFTKLDSLMPLISMFGIIYFTTVTTAAGRENLMRVGFLLFICSVIHNGAGYFFGYWLSRLFGLDKDAARTVAFEVGLQNGGMASGLAGSMGKLGTVGLPAAVFSPWMNISGSLLANYWRRRPTAPSETTPGTVNAVTGIDA